LRIVRIVRLVRIVRIGLMPHAKIKIYNAGLKDMDVTP
jgi:hypothetical protein